MNEADVEGFAFCQCFYVSLWNKQVHVNFPSILIINALGT